ncbi:MAG: hypothetical protein J0H76_03505 [Sphingobacteriales bacterium]|nr:hypothetical protein [Sphingobacteriales bacterium]
MTEEEKEPMPVPSLVLVLRSIVGLTLVPQTTPFAVMVPEPCELILPPVVTPVVEIFVAPVVVTVGNTVVGALSFLQEGNANRNNTTAEAVSVLIKFFLIGFIIITILFERNHAVKVD